MKKIVKKGLFISFIYLMAIVSTLMLTDRVAELESNDLRNNNQSLAIKIGR
ncbi:MAG: hypothetical protein J6A17_05140 [Bacilli bacterium]|nr:hypothetical protein [Bacilli bacterium]